MAQVKRDDVKQSWEDSEFPLVCETCLGDNPYVRMTKEPYGKKCQVCETPFTVFAWQAGTKGRMKRVEICKSCAQAKNVCQVCIYDLQYGLPVKVRDKVLRDAAAAGSGASASGSGSGAGAGATSRDPTAMIPQSNANRAWFTAQQQRMVESGQITGVTTGSELAHAQLREMAVMEPRYERNLPKLCSFYAKGECDRGSSCPFRHEMPRDRSDPMSKQNTKDRFYGTSDPVASKILGRKRRQEEMQEKKEEAVGFDRAPCTLYLRLQGDPPFPPMSEGDVRDQLYAFGEIVSVRIQPNGQAFVEYTSPEATELAISSMNKRQMLGRTLFCSWARAPKRGEGAAGAAAAASRSGGGRDRSAPSSNGGAAPSTGAVRPVPPPGAGPGMAAANRGSAVPSSLPAVRLPPEVAAIAAARKQKMLEGGGDSRPGNASVPRPGIGGIRDKGGSLPYPSTDPQRMGSKATSTSEQ